jgi:hypothetical protein
VTAAQKERTGASGHATKTWAIPHSKGEFEVNTARIIPSSKYENKQLVGGFQEIFNFFLDFLENIKFVSSEPSSRNSERQINGAAVSSRLETAAATLRANSIQLQNENQSALQQHWLVLNVHHDLQDDNFLKHSNLPALPR